MPIYGTPGMKGDTSWAKNEGAVNIGNIGERKTAELLNKFADTTEVSIFHDVRVPNNRGFDYNIDHIVVSGNHVGLIDSKAWLPGLLWTSGGITRRWATLAPAVDKKSVAMAYKDFSKTLRGVELLVPMVVVWPSRPGRVMMRFASMPGAMLVHPSELKKQVKRIARNGPADDSIVTVLNRYVN